ncbi:EF-hand domain [Macleaya cordata]|uniref:EF-hand domain n=1 Tax=Macleaya cordata TaxID=56857 RepID=A0A200QZ93_MACCD|nr:EF-hand domain [Macleaya cordata]
MAFKQGRVVKRSVSSKGKREMTMEEFKLWLKEFDDDGDGRISKEELREAIRSVGGGGWFTTWKSGRGIRSADDNRDGFISDNEINNLVDFAKKQLGVKIVPY